MNKLLLAGIMLLAASGCHMTVEATNPRPNVVVPATDATFTLDASHVRDVQELDRVSIHQFRQTLENAFRNAVGDRYEPGVTKLTSANASGKSLRLVIDMADLEFSNFGNIGRFLTIRYRASWCTPDGRVLARVAGTAQPRNPTETGARHLEDVVEVMYEKIIDGIERVSSAQAVLAPAGERR